MAKQILRQWMRDRLMKYLGENVAPSAEKKAVEAAYAKIAPLVHAVVVAKYPTRDMKVLQRYGCAREDRCINLQLEAGGVSQFQFKSEADAPLVPSLGNCARRIYLADAAATAAYNEWSKATDVLDKETRRRIEAYRGLVLAAQYLDDVVAVWPEVADLFPKSNLPTVISPETLAIIQADRAERKAA